MSERPAKPVRSVLFVCNMNSVRSPMAEAIARARLGEDVRVESCGVHEGILDPFAAAVLEEAGIPRPERQPRDFASVRTREFDVVVALTPEAAVTARKEGVTPEFWDTPNPTEARGGEAALMSAYRETRDALAAQIAERFG